VVATSFEIDLLPLVELFGGSLAWPIEQAHEVVHAYRTWIATVPESVTSTIRLMRFPPLPQLPEPLRGRRLVLITLAFAGSEAEGAELVAPLRAVAPPYLDLLAMMPGAKLGELSGDPPGPLPAMGGALLLDEFTEGAADAFLALGGPGQDIPLLQLEIRHLGGARPPARRRRGSGRARLYGASHRRRAACHARVRPCDPGDARARGRAARAVGVGTPEPGHVRRARQRAARALRG
jgi:hypothetical protein